MPPDGVEFHRTGDRSDRATLPGVEALAWSLRADGDRTEQTLRVAFSGSGALDGAGVEQFADTWDARPGIEHVSVRTDGIVATVSGTRSSRAVFQGDPA